MGRAHFLCWRPLTKREDERPSIRITGESEECRIVDRIRHNWNDGRCSPCTSLQKEGGFLIEQSRPRRHLDLVLVVAGARRRGIPIREGPLRTVPAWNDTGRSYPIRLLNSLVRPPSVSCRYCENVWSQDSTVRHAEAPSHAAFPPGRSQRKKAETGGSGLGCCPQSKDA